MKSTERHKLKENEFAHIGRQGARRDGNTRARRRTDRRRRRAGRSRWSAATSGGGSRARRRRTPRWRRRWRSTRRRSCRSPHRRPEARCPVAQPGTYQTEQAKLEAALPKFVAAADQFPNTDAGVAARYHAAGILAALGRYAEAEQRYQEVVDKAGRGIYGRTARLGLADAQVAQGKFDPAIKMYQDLTTDSGSQLPVDGVLMQLGRAYAKAGKKDEAARAFNRVVEEFPQSLYAADARARTGRREEGLDGPPGVAAYTASKQCAGARADDFDAPHRAARHEDHVAGRQDRGFPVDRDLDQPAGDRLDPLARRRSAPTPPPRPDRCARPRHSRATAASAASAAR